MVKKISSLIFLFINLIILDNFIRACAFLMVLLVYMICEFYEKRYKMLFFYSVCFVVTIAVMIYAKIVNL